MGFGQSSIDESKELKESIDRYVVGKLSLTHIPVKQLDILNGTTVNQINEIAKNSGHTVERKRVDGVQQQLIKLKAS